MSSFVIGVGSSWLLGFYCRFGAMGLMLGRVVGKLAHVLSLLVLVVRTDFQEECELAQERIRKIQMKALAAATEESTGGSELSAAVEPPAMEEDLVLEVEEEEASPVP